MPQIDLPSKTIGDEFLAHDDYRFEVVINPVQRNNASRKIVPIKGREAISAWFIAKAPDSCGFAVHPQTFEVITISVKNFTKKADYVTQPRAQFRLRPAVNRTVINIRVTAIKLRHDHDCGGDFSRPVSNNLLLNWRLKSPPQRTQLTFKPTRTTQ
jgi:hypothetical protein